MAPYADKLGWHPIFPIERIMGRPSLSLIERRPLWPLGLFTLVRFRKVKNAA
jgi:phosphatidylethanolamine/phosphatidyl-N-methylethanolamine N-methyltransferase